MRNREKNKTWCLSQWKLGLLVVLRSSVDGAKMNNWRNRNSLINSDLCRVSLPVQCADGSGHKYDIRHDDMQIMIALTFPISGPPALTIAAETRLASLRSDFWEAMTFTTASAWAKTENCIKTIWAHPVCTLWGYFTFKSRLTIIIVWIMQHPWRKYCISTRTRKTQLFIRRIQQRNRL
jgi:hypothetical protein